MFRFRESREDRPVNSIRAYLRWIVRRPGFRLGLMSLVFFSVGAIISNGLAGGSALIGGAIVGSIVVGYPWWKRSERRSR